MDRLFKNENLLLREVENETFLYDPSSDLIHVLNKTALQVWKLCNGKYSSEDIIQLIARQYQIPSQQIESGILRIISKFEQLRLIKK